jgi:hypothetical protein
VLLPCVLPRQRNPQKEHRLTKRLQIEPPQKELLPKPRLKELQRSQQNAPVLLSVPQKKPVLLRKPLQRHLQHQRL